MNIRHLMPAIALAFCAAMAIPAIAQQGAGGRGGNAMPSADRTQAQGRDRQSDRDGAADRDQDRDTTRDRDREPLHTQDRDRLRDKDVYGVQLMTADELARYRQQLGAVASEQEWVRMQQQHQQEIQVRAQQRGVAVDPPVYGQAMMTAREQARYRDRVEGARNERRRAEIRAEHQVEMQQRARMLGMDLPDPFYGQQLMTEQERLRLEERLRTAATEQAREQIRLEHRQEMQNRARANDVPLESLDVQ